MTDNQELNEENIESKSFLHSHRGKVAIPIIIVILGSIVGFYFYWQSTFYESTDDAFVNGNIVRISPQIYGPILKLYVKDNQKVKAGQLLIKIEDLDYQVAYEEDYAKLQAAIEKYKKSNTNVSFTQITANSNKDSAFFNIGKAKANIAMAGNQIRQAKSNLDQVRQEVYSAKADYNLAKTDLDRYKKLYKTGAISRREYEKTINSFKNAEAKLISSKDKITTAQLQIKYASSNQDAAIKEMQQASAQYSGANTVKEQYDMSVFDKKMAQAEIKQLEAIVKQDLLNLSYTQIFAPQSGYVTARSVEVGAYVQPGQPLLSIVRPKTWVVANFKETQLKHIKVGQKVFIKADAYPRKKFKAHVESIQYSTGSKTSLFPPENAVGSFVKVVQRVPVKIVFDEPTYPNYILAPGMSAVPEVKIK